MLYIRQLFTSFRFCFVDYNSNVDQNIHTILLLYINALVPVAGTSGREK